MNRRVPELVLGFCLENLGFLPIPAKHTSKETRGIRVDGLHHLDSLVPSDFLIMRIFGPGTNWNLIDKSNISVHVCLRFAFFITVRIAAQTFRTSCCTSTKPALINFSFHVNIDAMDLPNLFTRRLCSSPITARLVLFVENRRQKRSNNR